MPRRTDSSKVQGKLNMQVVENAGPENGDTGKYKLRPENERPGNGVRFKNIITRTASGTPRPV